MIEEDLPPAAGQPRRMVDRTVVSRAEASATRLFQSLDHFLRLVLVFADQDVDVVRHDRASVAGVSPLLDHPAECQSNLCASGLVEGEQGMLENFGSLLVESANLVTRRLDGFAA